MLQNGSVVPPGLLKKSLPTDVENRLCLSAAQLCSSISKHVKKIYGLYHELICTVNTEVETYYICLNVRYFCILSCDLFPFTLAATSPFFKGTSPRSLPIHSLTTTLPSTCPIFSSPFNCHRAFSYKDEHLKL